MGVTDLAGVGSGTSTTSGTTLAVVASANIPAGTLLCLALTFDNHASTTAATLSLSTSGGGTWTQQGTSTGSGVSTTAGSGIWGAVFTTRTSSAISSGATITTVTFGSAVVAKAAAVRGWTGVQALLRNTVASGTSTAGTPSAATTGTALVTGDLVIGTIHGENNAAPSADADTLNGSWSAVSSANTSGGQAATNTAVGIQGKVVTATGAQTYNATTANDSVAFVFALVSYPDPTVTQAAYRFYADGTESGSAALAGQNTAATADLTSGDVNLGMRLLLQSTNITDLAATDAWQLQWEKNGSGTWTNVSVPTTGFVAGCNPADSINTSLLMTGSGTQPSRVAQSFIGDGSNLLAAKFNVTKSGTPNGNDFAELYAHSGTYGSGGVPTGSALATSTSVPTTSLPTAGRALTSFSFDGTFTLTKGTLYFIAVTTTNNLVNSNYCGYFVTGSTDPGNYAQYISSWAANTFDLAFEVDGTIVTPTTAIGYASSNLTDGAATTNRLTGGTGTFQAGAVSEDGLADNIGWSGNSFTELLYSITLKAADLANGDTLRFRVLRNGATTGLTYTQTPTLNITSAGGTSASATGALTLNATATASSAGRRSNIHIHNTATQASFTW